MTEVDFVVIGAGAAGLSAALYGARGGLKTLVLDEAGTGGQIMQIDSLENYPGIFPAVNGADFIENLHSQVLSFGVKILNENVTSIDKTKDFFRIRSVSGEIKAYALLIATGAEHKTLQIPGEKEYSGRGVSYCAVCDGPFFKNKNVIVAGGGDSACSEALYLSRIAESVTIVHRRGNLRCQKTIEEKLLNTGNVKFRLNSKIIEIKGGDSSRNNGNVNSVILKDTVTGEKEILDTDAVFVFIGLSPRTKLLEILKKDQNGYIITNEKMETGIPGLYCAGDVRSKPLRQIVTACSDGAVAAFSAGQYINSIKQAEK